MDTRSLLLLPFLTTYPLQRKFSIVKAAILCLVLFSFQPSRLSAATPAHRATQITLNITNTSAADGQFQLKATVTAEGQKVTRGMVQFCEAAATGCQGTANLGLMSLTSDGTATLTKIFGPGTHSVYASFVGNLAYDSSTSGNQDVGTPGGLQRSITAIDQTQYGGPIYTFHAEVNVSTPHAPTGNISFVDDSTGSKLATTSLNSSNNLGFGLPVVSQVGFTGYDPLTGDLNNDGRTDIVASTGYVYNVFATLGLATGPDQFSAPSSADTSGGVPFDMVDMNADGLADVVTLNWNSCSDASSTIPVQVLFGDPTNPGHFTQSPTVCVPGTGLMITHGDFNGDGLPDLAVGANLSTGDGTLNILLNDPTHPGQLITGAILPAISPVAVAAGDFNHDGISDLVAINASGQVSVYLADRDHPGQFRPSDTYTTGYSNSKSITVADFNQDGVPDLAIVSGQNGSTPPSVSILLGDPAHPGEFLSPTAYSNSQQNADIGRLFVTDLNGDGALDLMGLNGTTLAIFYGDPAHKGQFLSGISQTVPGAPQRFTASTIANLSPGGLPSFLFFIDGTVTTVDAQTIAVTPSVSIPSQANSYYVHAQYSGDENYYGSTSCSIDLYTYGTYQPTISNLTVSNISATSATIQWTSNVPTNGYVQYGTSQALNQQSPWVNPPTTSHSVVLTGLTPGTTYNYQAAAVSFFSGCTHWTTLSTPASFTTAQQ